MFQFTKNHKFTKSQKTSQPLPIQKSVGAVNGMEGMTAPESVAIAIIINPMLRKTASEEVVE